MKCDVIFLIHEPFFIPFRHDWDLLYIPEYASWIDSALLLERDLVIENVTLKQMKSLKSKEKI